MKNFGYVGKITKLIPPSEYEGFELARVIVEHKERYVVQSENGIYNAEITGNLRFTATSRRDFPAVGDWVKVTPMDKENAVILKLYPRTSSLERQAIGKVTDVQIIATNIDYAFIVQSVGHDFNLKRMERYLTICNASDIEPIILLTKTDLVDKEQVNNLVGDIQNRIKNIEVVPMSSIKEETITYLQQKMQPYKTYCFMGSSGVGKSTIINLLMGQEVLKTQNISSSTNKGKHTTSHRELMILPNGSIVIDTPGMREIGMTENVEGIELTYDDIVELALQCKFNDCKHINEVGCAVLEAIEEGKISQEAYENYQKLTREQARFSTSIREKRQKSKEQGKMYKAILSEKRKNKF